MKCSACVMFLGLTLLLGVSGVSGQEMFCGSSEPRDPIRTVGVPATKLVRSAYTGNVFGVGYHGVRFMGAVVSEIPYVAYPECSGIDLPQAPEVTFAPVEFPAFDPASLNGYAMWSPAMEKPVNAVASIGQAPRDKTSNLLPTSKLPTRNDENSPAFSTNYKLENSQLQQEAAKAQRVTAQRAQEASNAMQAQVESESKRFGLFRKLRDKESNQALNQRMQEGSDAVRQAGQSGERALKKHVEQQNEGTKRWLDQRGREGAEVVSQAGKSGERAFRQHVEQQSKETNRYLDQRAQEGSDAVRQAGISGEQAYKRHVEQQNRETKRYLDQRMREGSDAVRQAGESGEQAYKRYVEQQNRETNRYLDQRMREGSDAVRQAAESGERDYRNYVDQQNADWNAYLNSLFK